MKIDRGGSPVSLRATPLGLYDMPYPSAPQYVQVRYAIESHRVEERTPLSFAIGPRKQ